VGSTANFIVKTSEAGNTVNTLLFGVGRKTLKAVLFPGEKFVYLFNQGHEFLGVLLHRRLLR
jgi:hypothetical protein